MIRLDKEYYIQEKDMGNYAYLRHFCPSKSNHFPVSRHNRACWICKKKTPKNIQFIYDMWCWHNDRKP